MGSLWDLSLHIVFLMIALIEKWPSSIVFESSHFKIAKTKRDKCILKVRSRKCLQLFWQNAKINLWPFSQAQHYYMVNGLTFKINDLAVKSFTSFKHSEVGNKTAHPIWLHLEKTSVLSKLLTHELSLLWYWFRVPCLKQYDFTIVQFNGIRHELDQILQRVYYHKLKLPFVHVLGQFYYLHQT